ncbi:hypothetical protein FS837_007716 [Tulasnella sp. UAMH 9824]|nr:hypothetical protein FS837_007716 [Tulasnella sp. UAMH 9824]
MSDVVYNSMPVTAMATLLIAIAVGYALLPRHPPGDVVPPAGQRLAPVVAMPLPGARVQQPNPQLADRPEAEHRFHVDDPVVATAPPSPPPNYFEFNLDTRIDGPVPTYSRTSNSRGATVEVVPLPNQNPPPAYANIGEGEEGGHV